MSAMFLATQEFTGGLDKENIDTPARYKMLEAKNTPITATKHPNHATPGIQPYSPMRRPLTQVNQDQLSRSTPSNLGKLLVPPHLQGTPKAGSKTLRKKSRTSSRKSLVTTDNMQRQWMDNVHLIADDLSNKILKEELQAIFKQVKMKYSAMATASCESSPPCSDKKADSNVTPPSQEMCQMAKPQHLKQDSGCSPQIQLLEQPKECAAENSRRLETTCLCNTDMPVEQPLKDATVTSVDLPVKQQKLASLVEPVENWTFHSFVSLLSPVKSVDAIHLGAKMSVNRTDDATMMTRVRCKDVLCEITPIKCQKVSSGMTPVILTDTGTFAMTPVSFTDGVTYTTPVRHAEMSSEMTPVRVADVGTSATSPISISDRATSITPAKHVDASSGTTMKMADASVCRTPVTIANSGTCVTPIHQANACTETSRIELKESGVTGTTINFNNTGTSMTPIQHSDAATTYPTTVQMVDECTETAASLLIETGTDPIPADTTCLGTMTSPVKVSNVEVCTESAVMVNAEVGSTPVRVVDSSCAMTPCRMTDNSTAITPVTVREAASLTSPLAIPVFRWEAENTQDLDPKSLLSHLETASICNQLLRREVQTLTEKHAFVSQQLSKASEDVLKKHGLGRQEEEKTALIRNHAKVSLEKDIEDLMTQIGEQMMQIGQLQGALNEKSGEVDVIKCEKAECQEQYQKQIHHLQNDLKTAYRQYQQQISELEDEVQKNNYKPHYQRAQETIKALQIELDAYSGLSDTMQKAAKIQGEFGCLEDAFSNVLTLFNKTIEKKQLWTSEHKAIKVQMETNQMHISEARAQLLQVELDKTGLQAEIEAAQQRELASKDLVQALRDEIMTANTNIAEIKNQLHTAKLDALGFQEDFNKSVAQCKTLEEANIAAYLREQSVEAALVVQGNQWKDTEARTLNIKSDLQGQICELQQQCQRLTSANSELGEQLATSQECRSLLQVDLNSSRATVEEQWTQLEAQTNELDNLRLQLHEMQEKIKELEDNTEFLDEERRALVDSTKELEHNLKVTSLELSRCKGALEESETAKKQWETAVESLSEHVQESQSELDNTKAYAHWMLLNQASEMREAAQKLEGLQQEMNTMIPQLKDTMGLDLMKETVLSPIKDSPSFLLNSSNSLSGSSSIVASVLSALQVKGSSTPKGNSSLTASPLTEERFNKNSSDYEQQDMAMTDSVNESSGSTSSIVIRQSSGSAFTSLRNVSNGGSSTKTPVKQPDCGTKQTERKERNNGPLLVDQVGQLEVLFGHILKGLVVHGTTLHESYQDLKDERNGLQKNITKSRHNFDSELSLLQEQLHMSEGRERALQQEGANNRSKLCELEQNLQYAKQRMQAMASNLARFSDQKYTIEKLKQDINELSAARKALETEKSTLQQVLDQLLTKVNKEEEGSKGSQVYGAVVKDNCILKMEIEKLHLKVLERQQHYESLNSRANRQMKVLEGNWKKAESEIYRLDDIFDTCKQLIQKVPSAEDENPNLISLRQLLD